MEDLNRYFIFGSYAVNRLKENKKKIIRIISCISYMLFAYINLPTNHENTHKKKNLRQC